MCNNDIIVTIVDSSGVGVAMRSVDDRTLAKLNRLRNSQIWAIVANITEI